MEPQKSNTAKYVIWLIVIVLIIAGIIFWANSQQTNAPVRTPSGNNPSASGTMLEGTSQPATTEVDFTDQGFVPNNVTIKQGDTVNFVNKSSEGMWVASNNHPTHTLYSGTDRTQHCPDTAGTAFDQCSRGNEYSFTFEKVGTWGYHNHANPSQTGTIIVAAN